MDRAEFMALESSKKAEVLNALLDEGKNQKEAMAPSASPSKTSW